MFEVGFSELLLCFIVALVVLGPQKLPVVARTLGRWTGRARMYVRNLTAELERETAGSSIVRDIKDAQKLIREETQAAKDALTKVASGETKSGE
jgi:sec-independent protein translocase protein TatB